MRVTAGQSSYGVRTSAVPSARPITGSSKACRCRYGPSANDRMRHGGHRLVVGGWRLPGESAQGASAWRCHLRQLVIHKPPNVVIVIVFDDTPQFTADRTAGFEVIEQLWPRGVPHKATNNRKGAGVAGHNMHDKFARIVRHVTTSLFAKTLRR